MYGVILYGIAVLYETDDNPYIEKRSFQMQKTHKLILLYEYVYSYLLPINYIYDDKNIWPCKIKNVFN